MCDNTPIAITTQQYASLVGVGSWGHFIPFAAVANCYKQGQLIKGGDLS